LETEVESKNEKLDELNKMKEEVMAKETDKLLKIKQRTEYLLSYHRGLEAQIEKFNFIQDEIKTQP
jgi:hypothetical protein